MAKYADHVPLYRQEQILARSGVERIAEQLKGGHRLFMDQTPAPVLDPGRGRTKTGYLWALARDDRRWGGGDPPAVV